MEKKTVTLKDVIWLLEGVNEEMSDKKKEPILLTTDDFCLKAEQTLLGIEELFLCKNKQYANKEDILTAFKEGAMRRYGEVTTENVLRVILDYKDKHDLALLKHGATLSDAEDRINDVIIYCIFAKLVLAHGVE